jgi:hypothetical protein
VNKLLSFGVLLLIAAPASLVAQAPPSDTAALEAHMRQVRNDIGRKREAAFRTLLTLNEAQTKTFQGLVKAYDDELAQLTRKDWELLAEFGKTYGKLEAAAAQDMAKRAFEVQHAWLDLQEKYFKQIAEQVSPVAAVQFVQLERRFEAQALTERMKGTPLAE